MMPHLRYLRYVVRHKWFVFLACCAHGIPLAGITHDLSKFRPDEWFAYVASFYGKAGRTPEVRAAFDRAWLFHQHRNPHHWQHWVLREDSGKTKVLEMPERYCVEMFCDWVGAGRAMGKGTNDVVDWYEKNTETILLAPLNRNHIEGLIAEARYRRDYEKVAA